MKKTILLFLLAALALACTACGSAPARTEAGPAAAAAPELAPAETPAPAQEPESVSVEDGFVLIPAGAAWRTMSAWLEKNGILH